MPNFSVQFSVEESGRKRPEYTLESDLAGEVTLADLLQFTKTTLILLADQILKEEQALGFDLEPIVTVDGSSGKKVADVSPLGKIEFTSRVDSLTIVSDTYAAIEDRSKVVTGAYKAANRVFYNGTQIAENPSELQAWIDKQPELNDGDLIRFVNIQPYARRLERLGVTVDRQQSRKYDPGAKRKRPLGFLVSVPNGVYALAARAMRAKYKRNSGIDFSFVPGSSLGLPAYFKKGRKGKNSSGRTYLYPSILITISSRGTT
jgi:hypothetical protein